MPITAIGAEFSGRRLFFKAEGDLVTLKLAEDGKGCGLYLHPQCRVMILGKQLETPYFAFTEIPGPPPKNYGADVSTLIRMIEAGEL